MMAQKEMEKALQKGPASADAENWKITEDD